MESTELLVYAMTLANETLAGSPDQDQGDGIATVPQRHLSRNGADLDLVEQFNICEVTLRHEDGGETAEPPLSGLRDQQGIEKILTMIATEKEKQKIQEALLANPEVPLGSAEQFLLTLSSISELSALLRLWTFKMYCDTTEKAKAFELKYLKKVPEVKDTVHKQSLLHHVCTMVVENVPDSSDLYSEIGASPAIREANINKFCRIISEFALEYRTTRERVLQQKQKQANHRGK
ncbi:FH1/FH2 domain-containing protein 3 [Fukomys damarensis]|uniref:FH1/FH2 domain-containing protein 3 n=1 Tax=Fukomys damarensis TaxID=885580 RepID=A0A091E578_FUKDA|nr:FH1/FH2 domain-containing protein 3 [Fukomys damarensis]